MLAHVHPSGEIYRVAKRPDPWEPPPYEDDAEQPRNRFDDPDKTYRVLYAASRPLGCFVETLARFRRSAAETSATTQFERELAEIETPDDRLVVSGVVPVEWVEGRVLGNAVCGGDFADVYHSSWNPSIVENAGHLVHGDVDLATLLQSGPREVSQRVSRLAFGRGFDGVRFFSRWGYELECWAVFEPFNTLHPLGVSTIDPNDEDFKSALRIHNLRYGLGVQQAGLKHVD